MDNGEITIEKNIPIPPTQNKIKGHREKIYPYKELNVGDSFFVPYANRLAALSGAIYSYTRKHGIKLCTRKVTENGIWGLRVWRIK